MLSSASGRMYQLSSINILVQVESTNGQDGLDAEPVALTITFT